MQPISPASRAVAERLLALARSPDHAQGEPPDPVVGAERIDQALAAMLSRWFGPYGYHALLSRALAVARQTHPALDRVRVRGPADPTLEGLSDAARAHGQQESVAAFTSVLAAVTELLGRLIGEDMAVQLMEQAVREATRGSMHADGEEPSS